MILTDLNGRQVYVNPSEIVTVDHAARSAARHNCRSIVRLRDGRIIEAQDLFEEVIDRLEPDRLEK